MLEGLIVDTNNCLNQVLLVFNSLNREYFLGFCLIDTFPGHFSFHIINHKTAEARIAYWNKVESIYKDSSNSYDTIHVHYENCSSYNGCYIHWSQNFCYKVLY